MALGALKRKRPVQVREIRLQTWRKLWEATSHLWAPVESMLTSNYRNRTNTYSEVHSLAMQLQ